MSVLLKHVQEAFASFDRPDCVVVHPGEECFDCPGVADALVDIDCDAILDSQSLNFARIPMDCLNSDALLHYFPAIVHQAFRDDGVRVAEDVAWILGADEWDTELTISEQIKPRVNSEQRELIRRVLEKLRTLPLSSHAREYLLSAIEIWHS